MGFRVFAGFFWVLQVLTGFCRILRVFAGLGPFKVVCFGFASFHHFLEATFYTVVYPRQDFLNSCPETAWRCSAAAEPGAAAQR